MNCPDDDGDKYFEPSFVNDHTINFAQEKPMIENKIKSFRCNIETFEPTRSVIVPRSAATVFQA